MSPSPRPRVDVAFSASALASAAASAAAFGVGGRGGSRFVRAGVRPWLRGRRRRQALAAEAADRPAEVAQRLAELARDHEDLVGLAARELGQHLQVLVGEEALVGGAVVDRLEDGLDRLRLTLGAQDRRRAGALGLEDGGLLLALGGEDRGLLDALGREDRGAAVALGAHLLLHRLLDGPGRLDGLELDAVDADAPAARGLVEHGAQLRVDLVAGGQDLLQRESADDVAQRGDGELLDRLQRVGDLVGGGLRVRDREVDDRVDADDEVVLGDHGLRRERDDLLAEVDQRPHAVDERDEQGEARVQRALEAAEALDHAGLGLRDDLHPRRRDEEDEDQ